MRSTVDVAVLRAALDYDPETGAFVWKTFHGPKATPGRVAGCNIKRGRVTYRQIIVNGRQFCAHALAWAYMTGEWPSCEIDHRDGDGLNNRWENLRLATQSQNQANRRLGRNNTSGFKGVSLVARSGRYRASIRVNGKTIWLGDRKTAEEAHALYAAAAVLHFGEYARVA